MSGFLDNFELADGTGWKAAAQAAPAALAGYQAIKAKRDYGNKVNEIETLMENRQQLNNPYANISNPFANLSVATEAAKFQAEQSDIALANTLDNLRQTGAGGATALAQAALQSKRGVSANIQQQEAQNQRLQAQGQQRVDLAKAQGQMQTMMLQEKRTEADLTRLQDQADLLKAQEIYSTQAAMSSLGAAAKTLAGGIVPSKLPEGPVAGIDFSKVTTSGTGGGYIDPAQQSLAASQFGAVNSNRYGLPEGGYDELNIGNSAALLASNEYSAGLSDEADAYYNAYKAWHEETYPGQPVTYASEGQGKIKSFNKALGYNN